MAPLLRSSIRSLRSGRKRLYSETSVSTDLQGQKKLKSRINRLSAQPPDREHGPGKKTKTGSKRLSTEPPPDSEDGSRKKPKIEDQTPKMEKRQDYPFEDSSVKQEGKLEVERASRAEPTGDFRKLNADGEKYHPEIQSDDDTTIQFTEIAEWHDDIKDSIFNMHHMLMTLDSAIQECKMLTNTLDDQRYKSSESPVETNTNVTDPEDHGVSMGVQQDGTEEISSGRRKRRKSKSLKLRFTHIKRSYLKFRKSPLLLTYVAASEDRPEDTAHELRTDEHHQKLLTDGKKIDDVNTTSHKDQPEMTHESDNDDERDDFGLEYEGDDDKEMDETINYETYRFNWEQDVDRVESNAEDEEIEEIFREMVLFRDDRCEKAVPQKSLRSGGCEHKRTWRNEVGWFCEICGLVLEDIQGLFIPEILQPSKQKVPCPPQKCVDDDDNLEDDAVLQEESVPVGGSLRLRLNSYYEEVLKRHQKEGFQFLIKNLIGDKTSKLNPGGCILAHAPGTGKTLLTISFIQSFLSALPGEGRVLIVAPKIMLRVWQTEFLRWAAEEIPVFNLNECSSVQLKKSNKSAGCLLRSRRLKLIRKWLAIRSVLLVSYSLFASLILSGLKDVQSGSMRHVISRGLLAGPELMVLDEGHFPRTKRTRISQALMLVRTKRRILLSGTLFQNNFKELFNLLKLVREDFLLSVPEFTPRLKALEEKKKAHSPRKWGIPVLSNAAQEDVIMSRRRECEEQIFMEEIGCKLEEFVRGGDNFWEINRVMYKLRSLTSPIIHWYPGKVLDDLPGLMEYVVYLNLTPHQEQLLSCLKAKRGLGEKTRLTEICIHPALMKPADNLVAASTPSDLPVQSVHPSKGAKTAFLIYLVELCNTLKERLLIFSQTLAPLALTGTMLTRKFGWKKGVDFLSLDGTMQSEDRQHIIEQFNDEGNRIRVLLASVTACKEGISLVGASRIVLLDVLWNPSVARQAVSRAFRIGQKRKVFVYRLVAAETLEEHMLHAAVQKDWFSRMVMDQSFDMIQGGYRADKILRTEQTLGDMVLEKMVREDHSNTINRIRRYNTRLT